MDFCVGPLSFFRTNPECLNTVEVFTLSIEVSAQAPVVPGKLVEGFVSRLARFFPNATPVRVPVRLTRMNFGGGAFSESTVIEFGTNKEVLFASGLPLEFADKLRLENSDGSLDTDVSVVAVQYERGKTAIAARFLKDAPDWIVKL